jgi:hypothetical protein
LCRKTANARPFFDDPLRGVGSSDPRISNVDPCQTLEDYLAKLERKKKKKQKKQKKEKRRKTKTKK